MSGNGDGTTGVEGGGSSGATSKHRPTKQLPTNRIQFSKQLDILRAYAALSGPSGSPVSNKDVAEVVGMVESTVSINNSFLTDVGLVTKTGSGFIPSTDVLSYHLAYEWNPETATHKLAPTLRDTWFGETMIQRLRFKPMTEDEAVHVLAEQADARKKYEKQVSTLLEYLIAAGIAVEDNGHLKLGPTAKPGRHEEPREAEDDTPATAMGSGAGPKPSSGVATGFSTVPTEGVVQFHISVRVDMGEFKGWKADRITAFFGGIAQVLAAKGDMEGIETAPPTD